MNSPLPELPELLASIRSHADLMKIPESELPWLAEEIRNTLIHSLSLTGGHLGPNLGVVELSIALHRVFETPRDKSSLTFPTRPTSIKCSRGAPR